ncbi:MAG: hypothetical protein IPN42_12485 [Methylococcaceae bacterium]|nr:hypothetical protein [Methylococcaceae bacterium]
MFRTLVVEMSDQENTQDTVLTRQEIKEILSLEQNRYWHQLHADLIDRLCRDYRLWPAAETLEVDYVGNEQAKKALVLVHFLRYEITHVADGLVQLKSRFGEYTKRYTKAISDSDKKQQILNYAKELGATPRQLRKDEKAFERWFGHDTVSDRYQRRYLETERFLSFALQCLGKVGVIVLQETKQVTHAQALWRHLQLETVLKPLLDYHGDNRVLVSAFHALSETIRALPEDIHQSCISDSTRRFILHSCRGNQSIWVQCEALQLLQSVSPTSLKVFLRNRFEFPKDNDDLFVRRKVVQIVVEQLHKEPGLEDILVFAVQDNSPSVRQKLAELLPKTDVEVKKLFYPILLFGDKSAPVRASALLSLLDLLVNEDEFELALVYLGEVLLTEKERFVLRTALHVCRTGLDKLIQYNIPSARQMFFAQSLQPAIKSLHETADSLAVRRYAAQTKEYLFAFSDEGRRQRINRLKQFVEVIPPGKTRRLPKTIADSDDADLGRLLSVIAQKDFGFDVESSLFGRFITRGHAFGFRLWRLFHEFRHPSPDKRQAFRHTVGRLFWGELRVPSTILSELAETKIPGEPLFMDTEDGWRGYLPLVDEVISALALGNKSTYFYHSEGVVLLIPPRYFLQRLRASWKLSFKFSDYAHLRNWQEKGQSPARSYLDALAALGIKVCFRGHDNQKADYRSIDPAVLRFFPAFIPDMPGLSSSGSLWLEFKDYFVSAYGNSLIELAAFLSLAMTYFMGRHVYLYRKFRRARNRIPLVLGGWGHEENPVPSESKLR